MKTLEGIDISKWQGKVDFSKVKMAVDFVILREGYRKTIDQKFIEYVKGCNDNGIQIPGVYHFIYALSVNDAVTEANSCIKNVKKAGLGKDIIIFADFEYDTVTDAKKKGVTLGSKECIAFTQAFCETVEKAGYKAGIYTNQDYYKNMYKGQLVDKYVLWFADYEGSASYPCTFHQTSASGSIPGISGNVDTDKWYQAEEASDPVPEQANVADKIVEKAVSFLGYNEKDGSHKKIIDIYNNHKPLARGYKVKYTDAWCATFVSAVAIECGCTDIIPTECGCQEMIKLFQNLGRWIEDDSYSPAKGDVIFYDWQDSGKGDDTGYSDHVGIVEKNDGKTITVIEGNKADAVSRREIAVNGKYIRGYGILGTKEASEPVQEDSIDELVEAVLAGQYGTGDARKQALGDKYEEVQAEVNKRLKKASEAQKIPVGIATNKDDSIAGTYTVTDNLNLREGAGTDHKIIKCMLAGTKVISYGYYTPVGNNKWYYVVAGNDKGFCDCRWLSR